MHEDEFGFRVRENRLEMSFWMRNFGVPDVHAGISGLSELEDFRAAEFDLERKLGCFFFELERRPLD